MSKKKGRKKRNRKGTNWGDVRKIDGKTFKRVGVYSRKESAKAHANRLRKGGYNARVLDSPGSYAVYIHGSALTERQEDLAQSISEHPYGKAKTSQIKSQFVWDKKDEPKVSKDVLELKRKGIVEKIEPKGDIEPMWKLTRRGKDFTDYDPHAFDE